MKRTGQDSNMWQDIPDTWLLEIFQYLKFQDLVNITAVCKKWQRVALDETLWRKLMRRTYNIKNTELAPGKDSWYSEYKRFYYHTPAIESEVLTDHTDEVLDVAFSHNGKYVCTTSKDCTVKVWEIGFPTKLKYSADLKEMLEWSLTQYAVFNKTDDYLLVCGVNISGPYYSEFFMGHGAIFDMTQDFTIIRVMGMNPPHLFADWADTEVCLGGYATNHDHLTINSFKVPDKRNRRNIETVKTPDPQEILDNTDGNRLCTFYADCNHTMNLMVANVPIKPKPLMPKCDINRNANSVIYNSDRNNGDTCIKYLIFVAGVHDCIILHELKNVKTTKDFDEANAVRPFSYDVIRRPGQYISGMKLSHDHRYLYFNFREAVKEEENEEWEDYLHLKENLQVNVIDLQTKQIIPDIVYEGHKGFSEYPAWYICLDTSDDIVASGSEEAKAYLWDKYYRCLITTLQHREGVVNGLEFNPKDCETMVTSGDDQTIRIWRSRNRMKSLQPVDFS